MAVTVPVKKARAASSRGTSLREPVSGSGTATKAARKPPVPVADRRIYHVTHIGNLAAIVERGSVLSEASAVAGAVDDAVPVFSQQALSDRSATRVPGRDSGVADHVSFTLTPNSSVWESIRAGIDDPRLDPAAAGAAPAEFVILVSTVRLAIAARAADDAAAGSGVVVTDGYAAGALTRFATTGDDVQRMLSALGDDDEPSALVDAELLVPGDFPFESVTLIGVANDRVRDEVRRIHHAAAHAPKVAVYPPWFQASEDVRY
ncbi:MAG: DarT ssDNA thymidine ADP-ribosyltransferase family protein [Leifsonia sp.]